MKEKIDKHNLLLEKLRKIENSETENCDNDEKQKIMLEKTKIVEEIEQIRKELKINTSTIISYDDIK